MHILGLQVENIKRIRVARIIPKGNTVLITGKNGQGKTSVIDAIMYGLQGKKSFPEKPVRKGAEKGKIQINLGDYLLTRTIGASGNQTLLVETKARVPVSSPQALLDSFMGEFTFDPLEFIGKDRKQQIDTLRQVVKLDIDPEAIDAQNEIDFAERRIANREVDRLATEVAAISIQDGLPAFKIELGELQAVIDQANVTNEEIKRANNKRLDLHNKKMERIQERDNLGFRIDATEKAIIEIKRQLAEKEGELSLLKEREAIHATAVAAAQDALEACPERELIDVSKMWNQMRIGELTNREIDRRDRRDNLQKELNAQRDKSAALTRAMEKRNEQKAQAIATAKMPVEGLTFDDEGVMYKGIPIAQLGEAEQLRISMQIAMAGNPKLRILRIMHGEALDEESITALAKMAEENDFQVWMARVDSSGKIGIVMEDGEVKAENQAEAEG